MSAADTPAARPAGGFGARTLASLRSRNLRLFFVGQTISNTVAWLTMVALTLLVLQRTGSGTAVGGHPVRRALVNEMVPLEDVPNAVTVCSATVNLSRVAGPARVGVLVVSVGDAWTVSIDAISSSRRRPAPPARSALRSATCARSPSSGSASRWWGSSARRRTSPGRPPAVDREGPRRRRRWPRWGPSSG